METNDMRFSADAADITPQTLDYGIPTMEELLNSLFAGFAPIALKINADAKDRRAE